MHHDSRQARLVRAHFQFNHLGQLVRFMERPIGRLGHMQSHNQMASHVVEFEAVSCPVPGHAIRNRLEALTQRCLPRHSPGLIR